MNNRSQSLADYGRLLNNFSYLRMKECTESQSDYDRFFNSFGRLHLKKKLKTLLEIARFPRSELAHSNILAFFLDPNEDHGLGDAFLESLLKTAGSHLASDELGKVEVIREVRTDSNKSIDIVVEGQSFVVGIEHKIDATAYNPFGDYRRRLEEIAKERHLERILLSLKAVTRKDLSGFKPIIYKNFFNTLESRLEHASNAGNKVGYQHAREFVTTVKNLTKGTLMDIQFVKLVKKDQKTAVRLYLELEALLEELKNKRDEFKEGIKLRPPFGKLWSWDDQKDAKKDGEFFSTAVVDVKASDDLVLSISADLTLKEWTISAWKRRGNEAKAKRLLRGLKIEKCPNSADLTEAQAIFQKYVDVIGSRLKGKPKR